MHETIQAVLAPLASFWVVLEGYMKATSFVNNMRETIITGVIGSTQLTIEHRKAIFVDWCLSMIGFMISNTLFAWVIASLAKLVPKGAEGIYGVALITFLGVLLFLVCGISDFRAIRYALKCEQLKIQNNSPDMQN